MSTGYHGQVLEIPQWLKEMREAVPVMGLGQMMEGLEIQLVLLHQCIQQIQEVKSYILVIE